LTPTWVHDEELRKQGFRQWRHVTPEMVKRLGWRFPNAVPIEEGNRIRIGGTFLMATPTHLYLEAQARKRERDIEALGTRPGCHVLGHQRAEGIDNTPHANCRT